MNEDIVIVAAKRTPLGHFGGCFKDTPAPTLGAAVIKAILKETGLSSQDIAEVYMGCVLAAGLGQAPARQAALAAGLSDSTPCTTINKMCGSGMKSLMLAFDAIRSGRKQAYLAGGMENMSSAPYLLPKARFGYRIGHDVLIDHMMRDGLEDVYHEYRPMGYFAEQCAKQYQFTREQQDAFALTSLKRAIAATHHGLFKNEIVPLNINTRKGNVSIHQDEGPELAKPEKIPQLKPAFAPEGTVTAANSSSISDGAAVILLMPSRFAAEKGLKPLARILAHETIAQAPEAFTTAPIKAIQQLLTQLHWNIDTVDLFEVNEAFAAVTMAAMKDLQIPQSKMNVHGGACVLGHPIGASGARIVVTLLHALRHHQLKRGIASLCIGGGEATALAIETL